MIVIKTEKEIELMRYACKITGLALKEAQKLIKPGITTMEINDKLEAFIKENGCKPTFKNYGGFPYAVCISVNNEVVHGRPSKRVLVEGDIVSVDVGAEYEGYTGDAARTFPVGKISEENEKLISVCKQSFFEGLKTVKNQSTLKDLGSAIQQYVEANGFSVVRDLCGHGVGKNLHEDPQILNYDGYVGTGGRFYTGQTVAIEPMINAGSYDVNYNHKTMLTTTCDGKNSAHYENTVLVTENGAEILTNYEENL